jgi:hypothetical protein
MSEEIKQETPTEEAPTFTAFWEHQKAAVNELGKAFSALISEEFKTHTSNAGAEFVKSFQVLVERFKYRGEMPQEEGEAVSEHKVKVEVK